MPASELLKFVKTDCRQKAKGQSVEVKSAHVDGPRLLYDTLSSFSSQDSGDIKRPFNRSTPSSCPQKF